MTAYKPFTIDDPQGRMRAGDVRIIFNPKTGAPYVQTVIERTNNRSGASSFEVSLTEMQEVK